MGASFSLVLYGPDRAGLESAAEAAFDEVHRLDRLLSNYLADSEWSAMNRAAANGPFPVSPELFTVLSSCLEYSRQSSGAFDITVGPLMKMWGFYKGEGGMPRPAEVAGALDSSGLPPRAARRGRADRSIHPVRAWSSTPAASARATPWTGWSMSSNGLVSASRWCRRRAAASTVWGRRRTIPGAGRSRSARRAIRTRSAATVFLEGHVAVDVRQLRKVLLGRRANLLAHHGSADGLPRAGHVVGLRGFATNDRQRGVDETVLHQRPRLDVRAQAGRVPRVLL